jgi:hypothetical protein
MTTWILILSIFGGEGSAAVTSVPGFDSQAACQVAGKKWADGIDAGFFSSRKTSYVCVEQKLKVEQ